MNGTVAPLLRENDPTASEPTVGATHPAVRVQVTPTRLLPAVIVPPFVTAPVTEAPPLWMAQPAADVAALEVPVLVSVKMQSLPAMLQVETCALTCAELVNDPNRPKTNPAMAMAAISVIAIRITVARTGEIAFLRLLEILM